MRKPDPTLDDLVRKLEENTEWYNKTQLKLNWYSERTKWYKERIDQLTKEIAERKKAKEISLL